MTIRSLGLAALAAFGLAGCTTLDYVPPVNATDCFYPACSIDVTVVDDGKGGKILKAAEDGNVRMGTRHRVVAIVWNLRTPGYEFRGNSVAPRSTRSAPGAPITPSGAWSQEIIPHSYWWDNISVTNLNNERRVLYYDLTVYPSLGTSGGPLTMDAAILNDPCPNLAPACR